MPPVEASVPARALTPDYAGILRFFGRLGCPRKRASRWEAPLQCGSMPFAIAFPSCSRFGLGFPPFRQTKELSASALAESPLHAAWRATASTFSQRPGCCAAGLIRNSFPQSTSAGAQGKISHAPVDSGFPGIRAQRMLLRSVLHLFVGSGGRIWQNAVLRPWNRSQRAALMHLGLTRPFAPSGNAPITPRRSCSDALNPLGKANGAQIRRCPADRCGCRRQHPFAASFEGYGARSSPRKNTATVPGPQWDAMMVPMSQIRISSRRFGKC